MLNLIEPQVFKKTHDKKAYRNHKTLLST